MNRSGWFGKSWGAPVCTKEDHIDTPVGQACLHCGEVFVEGDEGVTDMMGQPMHLDCHLRGIFGGVNHIKGTCTCCGGTDDPDPSGVSRREAARLAVIEWEKRNGISRP